MIGIIYIIRNVVNDYVYIGSTTKSISERYKEHLSHMNSVRDKNIPLYVAMRKLDRANFFIDKIVDIEVNDATELKKIEGEYIRKYISIGSLLYNIVIPGRSRNEYARQQYKHRTNYFQQYYETNKERIAQPTQCECGAVVIRNGLPRHQRSQKHTKWLSEQEI